MLLVYGAASLIHFVHNAEYIADYPNLPSSWTRADVYLAWAGLTAVGAFGWLLLNRGYWLTGLIVVTIYAAFGLESFGHYLLAPMAAYSLAMNATIVVDVAAAALLFIEAVRLMVRTRQPN